MKKLSYDTKTKILSNYSFYGMGAVITMIIGLVAHIGLLWKISLFLIVFNYILIFILWRCSKCGARLPRKSDGLTPMQCKKCGYFQNGMTLEEFNAMGPDDL